MGEKLNVRFINTGTTQSPETTEVVGSRRVHTSEKDVLFLLVSITTTTTTTTGDPSWNKQTALELELLDFAWLNRTSHIGVTHICLELVTVNVNYILLILTSSGEPRDKLACESRPLFTKTGKKRPIGTTINGAGYRCTDCDIVL